MSQVELHSHGYRDSTVAILSLVSTNRADPLRESPNHKKGKQEEYAVLQGSILGGSNLLKVHPTKYSNCRITNSRPAE